MFYQSEAKKINNILGFFFIFEKSPICPTLRLPQNKLCTPCAVVHGPSYGLKYSVDVIVASSTHCRDRNYPLLVYFFHFTCICMRSVFVVLSITKIVS
jgi:hypothetical protein